MMDGGPALQYTHCNFVGWSISWGLPPPDGLRLLRKRAYPRYGSTYPMRRRMGPLLAGRAMRRAQPPAGRLEEYT